MRTSNPVCWQFIPWSDMGAPQLIPAEAIIFNTQPRGPLVLFPEDFDASSEELWKDIHQWWEAGSQK